MEVPSHLKIVEVDAYWTWMGEDGIARTKVKPGSDVTLKEAKQNSAAVLSLSEKKSYPLLVDSTQIKSMTKEARDHFSINNRETKVVAFALLIDSPLSRIIGNFFMGLNKPRVPAKLFTNETNALEWLTQFLQK